MKSTTTLPPPQNVFYQCKANQKEKVTGINGNPVIQKYDRKQFLPNYGNVKRYEVPCEENFET